MQQIAIWSNETTIQRTIPENTVLYSTHLVFDIDITNL